MNFANPLLLAGLAAAVLPVLLHLLGRSRAHTVPWGATLLLDAAGEGTAVGRWRDTALMVIRCLAIALFALALSRPVDPAAETAAGGAGQAVVFVIDASPSMAHPDGQTTRLELARWTALDRLGKLRQGDQAGLVVLGQAWNVDLALTPDLQSVASQIASLTNGPLFGDLADGERRARAMLADAGLEGGEIDLIADRQRTAWEPLADANLAGGARLIAMPVGDTRSSNARVESVEPLDLPLIVGQPARFAVRVRNDGDAPHGDLPLRVSIGTEEDAGPVAVDAHGSTRAVRTVTPTWTGPAVVTAALPADGLPGDDTMRLAVDVLPRPRLSVLSTTPTDFGPAFDVVPFDARQLRPTDIIVVNDVAADFAAVEAVERHVATGGALVVAAGPALPTAVWNTRLWKGGFGLTPAATADVKPPNGPARLRLAPGASEPVYGRVDGDPLAVGRSFGRGRVVAVAQSLQQTPDAAGFVRTLIARAPSRNLDFGVPIEAAVRPSLDWTAIVVRPDGRIDRVGLNYAGGEAILRYARNDLPGRYAVRAGDVNFVDWFVRPEAAEADPRMLDDGQLSSLASRVTLAATAAPSTSGRVADPAGWLLAAAAVLLGGEVLLADRFLVRRGGR